MLEKQLPYKIRIYEEIKKDILHGYYTFGETLNERELSERYGISRTPIREAIQMLAQDGWVSLESYKGATVREFDPAYVKDIAGIRAALEVCAAENAARHITDKDIEELNKLQKRQTDLRDSTAHQFISLDREFHQYIYALSGNKELLRLLNNYYDFYQFMGMRAIAGCKNRREDTLAEHRAIVDALAAGDPRASVDAMRRHMQATETNLIAHLPTPKES